MKDEFDSAFSRLSRGVAPDDPDYLAARQAYGLWRVAIDRFGVPLLDTIEALEADGARPSRGGARKITLSSPIERLTADQEADLRTAFQDIDQLDEMLRLIDEV